MRILTLYWNDEEGCAEISFNEENDLSGIEIIDGLSDGINLLSEKHDEYLKKVWGIGVNPQEDK